MKISRILIPLLAAALLIGSVGCKKPAAVTEMPSAVETEAVPTEEPTPEPTSVPTEYVLSDEALRADRSYDDNNRVFYEIFVGSFSDSDGDGTGDLRGIINRMDYLNDGDSDSGRSLGVEGLWLTPIFKSPSYHKYDVTDYYTVDPEFGTQDDLVELIDLCHARDVKVILDLPINHTGSNCKWFSAFRAAHQNGDTQNAYYDFYSYYDRAETTAPAGRVFQLISGTQHFYECNFSGDMPELNFDNEFVRQTVVDVAEYYLNLGVDGFRFDAAKYVYYGDHQKSLEFWLWYLDTLREKKPDLYTVAEVWDGDGITDIYYPATNCFNFTISESSGLIAETAKKGDVNRYTAYIESYQNRVGTMRDGAAIVPFLTNHDMDRAAGFLTVASNTMQMAANLYLLGPGSPFIYYGEEIGMRGSRGGANTDANRRLAMLWGDGDTVKDPAGTTYAAKNQIEAYSYAANQLTQEHSLYTHYKKLLMIRKAYPAIARGEYKALKLSDTKVGGFKATLDGRTVYVLHNTTISEKSVDLAAVLGRTDCNLCTFAGAEGARIENGVLYIGAQTSVVLQ